MNEFQFKILFLFFAVLLGVSSCRLTDPDFDAKGDIEKGEIHLISYGFSLPPPPPTTNTLRQIDSLKAVYGFGFENRGCILDSVLLKKADGYNEIVIEHLSKRNGRNWYNNYQRQVDSLYQVFDSKRDSLN